MLKWLFKKKPSMTPKPGETWGFIECARDPFPPKHHVKILDVKDGWVRYKMGILFDDERKRVSQFTKMYKKVETTK